MAYLAIRAGRSVRAGRAWPPWPTYDEQTEQALIAALAERRWTVSWPSRGRPSIERRFAEAFAAYTGSTFAIGVDHGSSALVVALEALGVGAGDEVIVPVLTWVASATAVLRVGALPVLVDVDDNTGCIDPDAVMAALSHRTRAVIAVHLGSTVADLSSLLDISHRHDVVLVEDCAQALGARWKGRRVGTWGAVGAFSLQAGKVVTSGEGGVVTTDRADLHDRLQQLRSDGRRYRDDDCPPDEMELVEVGDVTGANYTMSELHAALALDQLERLDAQQAHRARRAQQLDSMLRKDGDFSPVPQPIQSERSIYEYGIRFSPGAFGDASVEQVAHALAAELERPVYPPDVPLHRSRLFRPETKRRFGAVWTEEGQQRALGRKYDGAEHFRDHTLLLHHSALLGDEADVDDIVAALMKVRAHRSELSL